LDQARPLLDHLEELRGRIIRSLLAVAAFAVLGYYLSPRLLKQMSDVVGPMVFLRPTEAFMARLKIALILGGLFSAPVWLYQLWRFVGVALTVSERRVVMGAVPFSALLFMGGASLAWFGLTPVGLKFLVGFGTDFLHPMISVEAVLEFALWMSLGLGILFQLPVVLAALASWGLVTAATLREYRKHAVLLILLVSGVVTPGPDVTSQLLMAVPTYLLFELSIFLCARLEPKGS
jgi:sec-independent protein translocase protein TatC